MKGIKVYFNYGDIMKINGQVYAALEGTPYETQQCGDHKIEIYVLDDYLDLFQEFVYKGKFAVWSSVDGVNYKLAVEKGYLTELKDLYSEKVNNVWVTFWDDCDKVSKKFSRVMWLVIGLFLAVFAFFAWGLKEKHPNVSMWGSIGVAAVAFFIIIFLRKLTTAKIEEANAKSLNSLREHFGEERFNALLEQKREYIDAYFERLREENDEADRLFEEEEAKRLAEENTEENNEE